MIILPMAVPAGLLPIYNGAASFTLTNLAFGFIAVAIAVITREAYARKSSWGAVLFFVVINVLVQCGIAAKSDTSEASSRLKDVATRKYENIDLGDLHSAAQAVTDPTFGQWFWSIAFGVMLIIMVFCLIWKDQ